MGSDDVRPRQQRKRRRSPSCTSQSSIDSESRSYHRFTKRLCGPDPEILLETGSNDFKLSLQKKRRQSPPCSNHSSIESEPSKRSCESDSAKLLDRSIAIQLVIQITPRKYSQI